MHAEITNTPNPGTSLNPCRMCNLHAEGINMRNTVDYVTKFLRINHDGSEVSFHFCGVFVNLSDFLLIFLGNFRQQEMKGFGMKHTKGPTRYTVQKSKKAMPSPSEKSSNMVSLTHSTPGFWKNQRKIFKSEKRWKNWKTKSHTNYSIQFWSLKVGLPSGRVFCSLVYVIIHLEKYSHSLYFLGFDGVKDTPVEILHVALLGFVKYLARDILGGKKLNPNQKKELAARLESFNTQGLNIPPINGKSFVNHIKSLVGKEFKILVQAAPFIFFQFLEPERKAIWTALCQLVPFIFITKIDNMEEYLTRLNICIKNFIYHAIKTTAQWVNKPKFHHLLHLPESIRRFGPATLFATEKFESFNGVLRNASIHSNRQSPGRDIAITFDNYYTHRFLLSGGYMYNPETETYCKASQEVLNIFLKNEAIRKSFGYNYTASNPAPPQHYPFAQTIKVLQDDKLPVPQQLIEHCSSTRIRQVRKVQIKQHETLEKGGFVVVSHLCFVYNYSSSFMFSIIY
jgi:hypothetical protein